MGVAQLSTLLARAALVLLAAWSIFQLGTTSAVPVADGYREAAALAQTHTPRNGNVLVSAHRDGNFIFNMRTMGERRDIGVRRADKLFVQISVMRQLGIRDMQFDQTAIQKILDDQKIAVVVAQTGYLSDQPTMQEFQRLLDNGGAYVVQGRVHLHGSLRKDERELVIYARK